MPVPFLLLAMRRLTVPLPRSGAVLLSDLRASTGQDRIRRYPTCPLATPRLLPPRRTNGQMDRWMMDPRQSDDDVLRLLPSLLSLLWPSLVR